MEGAAVIFCVLTVVLPYGKWGFHDLHERIRLSLFPVLPTLYHPNLMPPYAHLMPICQISRGVLLPPPPIIHVLYFPSPPFPLRVRCIYSFIHSNPSVCPLTLLSTFSQSTITIHHHNPPPSPIRYICRYTARYFHPISIHLPICIRPPQSHLPRRVSDGASVRSTCTLVAKAVVKQIQCLHHFSYSVLLNLPNALAIIVMGKAGYPQDSCLPVQLQARNSSEKMNTKLSRSPLEHIIKKQTNKQTNKQYQSTPPIENNDAIRE
jgi:hypothetical protein